MALINENYLKLQAGYLFPEISRRVTAFSEANPKANIIRLGIGDVVKSLSPVVLEAFHKGVDDLSRDESFRGYGSEQGCDFLREAICRVDYEPRGVKMTADEIFVSDGSKCDSANIQEIFGHDVKVAVSDPVYPVYVDSQVMSGRTGPAGDDGCYANLVYMPCSEEKDFAPDLPSEHVDLIYLCSPNNPTGTVLSREQLEAWVSYAKKEKAIILYDAAYEAFVSEKDVPRSIFEIDGAREVAIEFRSLSKTAGFTGVRCAYTVIPKELMGQDSSGKDVSIHQLWNRRQCTKFNGASYPVQRAAEAVFSPEGQTQVKERIAYYMKNADLMKKDFESRGLKVYGGINSPYVWLKTPEGSNSWDFFNTLLNEAQVVGTPGSGFGSMGEGFFRLSAFAHRENVEEAIQRMKEIL